jgi:aminoglycoside phosphotransferase (APT) family kinase protein
MRVSLGNALTGSPDGIVRCKPAGATYVPGAGCALRYEVEIVDARGEATATVVNARLFGSGLEAARYVSGRLAPLAGRFARRAETTPFNAPVACMEAMQMAVSVFPVDGDLPTLVDAADPTRVGPLLAGVLPDASAAWSVSLARYARGHRCVLRYASGRHLVVGKVIGNGTGGQAHTVLRALAAGLNGAERPRPHITVPRSLGYDSTLQLLLLAPVAGDTVYSKQLKDHLRGESRDGMAAVSAVDSCAEIAAGLHAGPTMAVQERRPGVDLARISASATDIDQVAPGLGRWLRDAVEAVAVRLGDSEALALCLCHGDFKHNQVLGEGPGTTLVDFDTVCRAEPALDLGQFLAYLRLKAAELGAEDAAERLVARFITAYAATANLTSAQADRLAARTAAFEALSLVGRAVHSWHKFKPDRLAAVINVLDDRLGSEMP